jgi:D-sedoheptulose 7-phosphate isomerase
MNELMTQQRIAALITESADVKRLLAEHCTDAIHRCIMLCGNGGSAADSQHIAAELVVRLRGNVERRAIAALALTVDSSILTAGGNDYGYERVFARQVEAYGNEGDVLIAITTSGTSPNVVAAVKEAHARGVKTIGLLGGTGGVLQDLCTDSVVVPSNITARIQECHILIGHIWCEMIEDQLMPGK